MSGKSITAQQLQECMVKIYAPPVRRGGCFFACGNALWGSVTASISGVVRDATGRFVPSAVVVALNTQTGVRWTINTDGQGFYSFQALPWATMK